MAAPTATAQTAPAGQPAPGADLALSRCAVHTVTCKPMPLAACCERLAALGFGGVCVWREPARELGVEEAAKIVRANGLRVPAYVRGGFFVSPDAAERAAAIDDNRRCLDEAAELGAQMLVVVPGAHPGVPLAEGRIRVAAGLEAVLPHAASLGVTLALEPLHPMYAGDRACVNTLAQARAICERLLGPRDRPGRDAPIGVAVDVYHVWWDPDLRAELDALGRRGLLAAFHTCDWLADTRNRLTDRGLMGDGVIDIRGIRRLAEEAGFRGDVEIEVIGERYWERDQAEYLALIAKRCRTAT